MRGRIAMLIAVAWLVPCTQSPAQPGPMGPPVRNVFFEAFTHASADSGLVGITVQYRIDPEFFMVQREAGEGIRGEFERRGEVLVELLDRSGSSRSRSVQSIHRPEQGERSPRGTISWLEGTASFELPPEEYQIFFEVTDVQSQNRFLDRARKLDARDKRGGPPAITACTFMQPGAAASDRLEGLNYGGDLLLSKGARLYLEITGLPPADSVARVRCEFGSPDRDEGGPSGLVLDTSVALRRMLLVPPSDSASAPVYGIKDTVTTTASLILGLPAEELLLRSYRMRVTVNPGPGEATLDRPVRVVWPGMPASLRNIDYALGALRYIAPPALLDSLASGSFEERRDNLEGFWREKDPEKKTPYNPFMIQYYQRVDYAAANFGTLRNPDGLGTDRAKVYILYGPPSRSERSLDPAGANRETWTYDRLKRTFVFEDPLKNGTYVLRPGQ